MGRRERDAVAQVPLFSTLSSRHLRRVADLAEEEHLMEGATIVREGDIGDTFYVILEGEAKVTSKNGRIVNRLRPGDFFGEISLLDGGPQTATVTAESDLAVEIIGHAEFTQFLRESPSVTRNILKGIARRLRSADAHIFGAPSAPPSG